jgi:hypothetical protein
VSYNPSDGDTGVTKRAKTLHATLFVKHQTPILHSPSELLNNGVPPFTRLLYYNATTRKGLTRVEPEANLHHQITNLLAIAVTIKMNYRGRDSNTDMEYWKESFTRNRGLAKLFSIIDLERLSEGRYKGALGYSGIRCMFFY